MDRVARTVAVRSVRLPRKVFNVFAELEGMCRNMVEQLVIHAVRSGITSFTRLKALNYHGMRDLYPQLPSHYIYTACQDASSRAKSFIKRKKKGYAKRDYPEIRNISIWLDDQLWKSEGYTSIKIATHKGWIYVEFEPHKQYWRYINRGWRIASEAKIKLDKRNRHLIIYLVFVRDIEAYKPRGLLPIDVNDNNITILLDAIAYLFETNLGKIVLGYHYRRKSVQKKYDKPYADIRVKKKIMRKLKEKKKKNDVRWKIANIVVRTAYEKGYAIVLERLGKKPAEKMISRIKDKQLRHRIFQASFRGVQRAIEEKAREYGVPIIYKNPRNTSRQCPIHNAEIVYSDETRVGVCSVGGEKWHRDVASVWNLLIRACLGDVSLLQALVGLS
ncbi:MAG: transposase [Sulfolobales archaeon]